MTKEDRKKYNKRYKELHRDRIREQYLKSYELDKSYQKEYYRKNKNTVEYKEKVKKYKEANKEKLKEYNRSYQKQRREKDVLYKISSDIRTYIINTLRSAGYEKSSTSNVILGCSFLEFKNYLESNFDPWMSWDNYGKCNGELNYGWDIDHVIGKNKRRGY